MVFLVFVLSVTSCLTVGSGSGSNDVNGDRSDLPRLIAGHGQRHIIVVVAESILTAREEVCPFPIGSELIGLTPRIKRR